MSDDEDHSHKKPKPKKIPNAAKVKNKAPNKIQITAEQLIREAKERELEVATVAPHQKITNIAELKDYQLRKRKDYEDNIRKNRLNMHNWIKYANFEDKQQELQRARSVYERALDVDHRCVGLWLKYSEMEMRHGQVNHARNLLDRAVSLLPRISQFWFKYVYMEEKLGNLAGCRQVFERWMKWQPEETAWHSYVNFEMRYHEFDRARRIYEIFVQIHPEPKNWIKYAKFVERNGYVTLAREIYERAVQFYDTDNPQAALLLDFARFEENQKEHERARVIYKFGIDNLPESQREQVFKAFTRHEKRFGTQLDIESVLFNKRQAFYEREVAANQHNYDAWFDYLRLMETEFVAQQQQQIEAGGSSACGSYCVDEDRVRNVYERAIANVPPIKEKRYWRRYIYLWIYYALFEELRAKDLSRTREVYRLALELIPHRVFTFSKLWLLYAKFEIRQHKLDTARKCLGIAIGMCPRDKLFREYIELEMQLREFDRCRRLYERHLEFSPDSCSVWMKYAELETNLGDLDRARHILELAISQPQLDMPERVWKAFIDFEICQCEWPRARRLYQRLLDKVQHVRVWISFAHFELKAAIYNLQAGGNNDDEDVDSASNRLHSGPANSSDEEENVVTKSDSRGASAQSTATDPQDITEQQLTEAIERARDIYKLANKSLKQLSSSGQHDKEQRVCLLESWKQFEEEYGDEASFHTVQKLQPQRVMRRRKVESSRLSEDNVLMQSFGWEEHYDYIFPDDEEEDGGIQGSLKLLAMAKSWKKNQQQLQQQQQSSQPLSHVDNNALIAAQ